MKLLSMETVHRLGLNFWVCPLGNFWIRVFLPFYLCVPVLSVMCLGVTAERLYHTGSGFARVSVEDGTRCSFVSVWNWLYVFRNDVACWFSVQFTIVFLVSGLDESGWGA